MTTPAGFAPVFPGWNVWDVWQAQDPILGIGGAIMNAGLSLERQLRIWVEDQVKDNAPDANLADPANPAALKGAQVLVVPNAGALKPLNTRAEIPELAGALQVGEKGSAAKKFTVRFFNRGTAETVMPWPHDENYVLDAVFQPDAANPLTSGDAPFSLDGAMSDAARGAGTVIKVVGVVVGVGVLIWVVSRIADSRKAAA